MRWWRRLRARMSSWFGGRRNYDAALPSRDPDATRSSSSSANALLHRSLPQLRNLSRDLLRNNPYAASIHSSIVGNMVGEGLMPRVRTGDANLDARVVALFQAWTKQCSATGEGLTFQGIQTLVVGALVGDGEAVVRKIPRRADYGLLVPLQLQVLESDHIDETQNTFTTEGGRLVDGVEVDENDRVVAYWLRPYHPGDAWTIAGTRYLRESIRIEAGEVAHVFRPLRPGQRRGVPWNAVVADDLRTLDDLESTELVRRRAEACMVAMVHGAGDINAISIGKTVTDASGTTIERMRPGMIGYLPPNADIKFNQPSGVGGFSEVQTVALRGCAAGQNVPYELASGDLSRVNYSSIRTGLIEFRRHIKTVWAQVMVPMFLDKVWGWFIDAAVMAGRLDDRPGGYPVEWSTPRFEDVDRLAEAQAIELELRIGATTHKRVLAERGLDFDATMEEIAACKKKYTELGLSFDWGGGTLGDGEQAVSRGKAEEKASEIAKAIAAGRATLTVH